MKDNARQIRVCPLCGRSYGEAPALSRTDNETLICPDCGTRQALESISHNEHTGGTELLAKITDAIGNETVMNVYNSKAPAVLSM